ncbi:hypothetical protein DICA1_F38754 [Diutina catenulata]
MSISPLCASPSFQFPPATPSASLDKQYDYFTMRPFPSSIGSGATIKEEMEAATAAPASRMVSAETLVDGAGAGASPAKGPQPGAAAPGSKKSPNKSPRNWSTTDNKGNNGNNDNNSNNNNSNNNSNNTKNSYQTNNSNNSNNSNNPNISYQTNTHTYAGHGAKGTHKLSPPYGVAISPNHKSTQNTGNSQNTQINTHNSITTPHNSISANHSANSIATNTSTNTSTSPNPFFMATSPRTGSSHSSSTPLFTPFAYAPGPSSAGASSGPSAGTSGAFPFNAPSAGTSGGSFPFNAPSAPGAFPFNAPFAGAPTAAPTAMTPASSTSSTASHPELKKQITMPSISVLPQMAQPSPNYRTQTAQLSARVSFVDRVGDGLVLDVRPYTEYATAHLRGALNLSLPSTLLKRANFTLQRCINSLPPPERHLVTQFFDAPGPRRVWVYDTSPASASVFHVVQKLVASPLFGDADTVAVCGFADYPDPAQVETGPGPAAPAPSGDLNLPPLKIGGAGGAGGAGAGGAGAGAGAPGSAGGAPVRGHWTPVLSNFALPKCPKPGFKIRHNEELLTASAPHHSPSTLEKNTASLFRLAKLPRDRSVLPQWMHRLGTGTECLNTEFATLEKREQKRLLMALSLNNNHQLSPLAGESPPTISSGFEYGHKNRYKDIFLYEHSRVKLEAPDDYINASYVAPPESLAQWTPSDPVLARELRYIATQGPLDQTMGDFWKLVVDKQSPLVISLTDEVENGVVKCCAFWKTGVYYSGGAVINVKLVRAVPVSSSLVLRHFAVHMVGADGAVRTHRVLQMHVLSWPDMGTVMAPDELIAVVELKHYVLSRMALGGCEYPSVIHCSAGCGRTGTLCTIDTVLSVLRANGSAELAEDPVAAIVDSFRRQRISMVQNLRQYYLVYDTVLDWAQGSRGRDLTQLEVVQEFIG